MTGTFSMRLAPLALALALLAGPAAAQAAGNAEMARIFAADQADRQAQLGAIGWNAVAPRDAARRAATQKLLADGALTTAEDFHAAAFVLQHGDSPDDYLLAHSLALAAVGKGKADSMWIATATLDRYLGAIGQPQIYGTQFRADKATRTWTQEPYSRALVPDPLRRTLGVKTQAEQDAQLSQLQAAMPAPKKSPP